MYFTAARTSLMSWFGIVGGALTILSNLQGVLDLARWAHWLAESWAYYVAKAVQTVFGGIGIRPDANTSIMICMSLFIATIAIAARIENDTWSAEPETWPISWRRAFNWRIAVAVLMYLMLTALTYYIYFIPGLGSAYAEYPGLLTVVANLVYIALIVIGLRGWPMATASLVGILMATLNYISNHAPMRDAGAATISENASLVLAVIFAVSSGIAILILAPPRAFCRRLIYMFVGVAILVVLSAVSTLGLSVSPTAS